MPKHPIVGTYKMISSERHQSDGDVIDAFGPDAIGRVTFTEDGHCFVFVMHGKRPHSTSADRLAESLEEEGPASDTCAGYCGPYEIDGNTITTHVVASVSPNQSGTEQKRWFEFKGNTLILRTEARIIAGKESTGVFIWERI